MKAPQAVERNQRLAPLVEVEALGSGTGRQSNYASRQN